MVFALLPDFALVHLLICKLNDSVPPAVLAAVTIFFAMPNGFPYHGRPREERLNSHRTLSKSLFRRLDLFGTALLLVATVLLVAALEEANMNYPWSSPFVISALTISGVGWIVFFFWEHRITRHAKFCEPVFPWRFVENRVLAGMIL